MATRLDVYDLYKLSLDWINVEERGQITIDRWNRAATQAVIDFINYLTGRLDEPPEQQLAMLKTQKIGDLCFPIFKRQMIPFKDGLIPYPSDYDYLLDLRISGDPNWKPGDCADLPKHTIDQILNGQAGFRQVDVLSHDEVPARANTRIPLLKKRPVAEQYDDGFLLFNSVRTTGSAFYSYLLEPTPVKLIMEVDPGTHMPVYVSAGSVHPPFDRKVGPSLARKISQYYALFVRDGEAIGMGDAVSKTK